MNTVTLKIIEDYRHHLTLSEKAAATIDKYIRDVRCFAEYLGARPITKELCIEYKGRLMSGEYAVRSVNSIIAAINSFLAFIGRYDCRLRALKLQRQVFCSEDRELSRAEYARLIAAAKRNKNERLSLIIQTICGTGIRVSELEFITAEAVKKGEATVSLKGKTRRVFIVRELRQKLQGFISREGIASGPVFITRSGKPLGRSNIWREMKRICDSAGVNPKKVFPHNLRHLFARTFYGIERDIAKLADILGHSSIDTTRIYIITSGDEHRRRMESMHLII